MRAHRLAALVAGPAAGLVLAASPAAALVLPRAGRGDARIRTVAYDPGQVVRVVGGTRTATEVRFAPDETVRHVALGDAGAWQVAAAGDALFLRARRPGPSTDLIVTTARGAATRTYVFELVAAARRTRAYVVRFRYPADDRARAAAGLGAATAALRDRLAGLELARGALEGPRNLAYSVQGPAALQPAEVTDNGRFTVLRLAPGQALPAIYAVAADGTESLAPTDVRGDLVVVHGVYPGLRLRAGRQVLCVTDDAYRAGSGTAPTRTAARQVARTDRGDAR